jgi:hypothetical protein
MESKLKSKTLISKSKPSDMPKICGKKYGKELVYTVDIGEIRT